MTDPNLTNDQAHLVWALVPIGASAMFLWLRFQDRRKARKERQDAG